MRANATLVGLLIAASSVVAQAAPESSRPLARANSAVLCYAQATADDASMPMVLAEIQHRQLACTPEMIDGGKARLASAQRAQGAQALTRQSAKVAASPVVYCTTPGTTQRVRCPNY